MAAFNLSKVNFTRKSDVVNPGTEIFNPRFSYIDTLKGDDQIIGTSSLTGDFAFGAFVGIAAQDLNATASADLSGKATVAVDGIQNRGIINTNDGRDIVRGTATASITATAETVSQVIAIANRTDTSAIANAFASISIKATADGIDNSFGVVDTGRGSDTVDGNTIASVAAVALATVDASAIIEAIAKAPMSEGLKAFAGAIAKSLAEASIIATGIKNIEGKISTGNGKDSLSATATSYAGTFAGTYASTLASITPDNQALAIAVADASAIASASSKSIAIDNTRGIIDTGNGDDTIEATASAYNKAIGIDNTKGFISTGNGDDTIIAKASSTDSFGIFGNGTIDTGTGNDRVIASSFGGGVNINVGVGDDFVEGFGSATVNGGRGFDTLSFGSYNKDNFNISFAANNSVIFQHDGVTMTTTGFEQFKFADTSFTIF
jgi:hypothetical protein